MISDTNYKYKARIYHDKAITEKIENDLKVMVESVLCGRKLVIEYNSKGFDPYPGCKHFDKKYCFSKPKKYRGYIKPLGFAVHADSEIGIYCKVIELLVGNRVVIPFSQFDEYDRTNE